MYHFTRTRKRRTTQRRTNPENTTKTQNQQIRQHKTKEKQLRILWSKQMEPPTHMPGKNSEMQ